MLRLGARFRRGQEPELPGRLKQHGAAGVVEVGHRSYVGGLWEEIGRLQFEFLRSEGLSPEHVLLDVACGSLRAGVHLIPYLKPGRYLGIDKEPALIEAGLKHELGFRQARRSRPEFQVSADFDFGGFSQRPDYALAQSLWAAAVHFNRRLFPEITCVHPARWAVLCDFLPVRRTRTCGKSGRSP